MANPVANGLGAAGRATPRRACTKDTPNWFQAARYRLREDAVCACTAVCAECRGGVEHDSG